MSFSMLMNKGFHAPLVGGTNIFIKCILCYIQVEGASCSGNRRFQYFYKVNCRIYCSRSGFMPQKLEG